jgi:hypothetical protein
LKEKGKSKGNRKVNGKISALEELTFTTRDEAKRGAITGEHILVYEFEASV